MGNSTFFHLALRGQDCIRFDEKLEKDITNCVCWATLHTLLLFNNRPFYKLIMLRKCNAWVICILFGLGIITASAWRDTTEDSSLKPEPQKKTSAPTIEDSAKEEVATVESIGQSSIDSAKKELANVESIGQSSFDSAKKGVATVENIGQSLVTHPQETISASAKQGLITAKAGEIIAESATQEAENVLNESAKEGSKILQSAEEKAKKVEKKVEFFITTWKFSSNPTVACLLCGCLLLFLFLFIRSCWLRFRSASYSSDGRRTGKKSRQRHCVSVRR